MATVPRFKKKVCLFLVLSVFLTISAQAESVQFVSGDVVSVNHKAKELTMKIYLDENGDYFESDIVVHWNQNTEITDGDTAVPSNVIQVHHAVDVEFDAEKMATYIFVYQS